MKVWTARGCNAPSKQKVMLSTPTYGGLCAEYVISLYSAQSALNEAGIANELMIYAGNCHVDDSRNRLVRDFLDSDCTDMVFIDADMRFRSRDLLDLLAFDEDVVGGTYPLKQDKEGYPVRFLDGDIIAEDGLIEVESVPTGFLRMKRNVLEKLAGLAPGFKSKDDKPTARKIPLIFERLLDGQTRWGGDYAFCKKWRDTGGKVHLAPEFVFGHIGDTEWLGSVSEYLLRENGLTDSYIEMAIGGLSRSADIDFSALRRAWGNDWSANVEYLTTVALMGREATEPILECGSGLTTLILGAVSTQPVHVLEQEIEHAQIAQEWVERMKWNHVHIYHAPIKQYDGFEWFEKPDDLPCFGLVVCDAPRRENGREGLVPVMNLQPGCKVLMDDIETEMKTIERWGLPHHVIDNLAIVEV